MTVPRALIQLAHPLGFEEAAFTLALHRLIAAGLVAAAAFIAVFGGAFAWWGTTGNAPRYGRYNALALCIAILISAVFLWRRKSAGRSATGGPEAVVAGITHALGVAFPVLVLYRLVGSGMLDPLVRRHVSLAFYEAGAWPTLLTFGLLVTYVSVVGVLALRRRAGFVERWAGRHCRCGYDLRGQPTGPCPECGRYDLR